VLDAALKLSMTMVNGSTQSVSFGNIDDVLALAAASATFLAIVVGSSSFTFRVILVNTSSSIE
jgi:hypothetical protein